MMPGLTAQGRKWRRARQAMEIALRENITPTEAKPGNRTGSTIRPLARTYLQSISAVLGSTISMHHGC